jgi:hypothetical protein
MTLRNDDIDELLHGADAQTRLRLLTPAEMARRVWLAERRGRQRRAAVGSAVVLLLMSTAVSLYIRRAEVAQPVTVAADVNFEGRRDLNSELAELKEEADMHARLARRMIEDREKESATTLRRRVGLADPIDDVRERVEIVAYRMIYDAEQLEAAQRPPTEMIVIYRDVIRLFPHTRSAELARQRLASLGDS